MEEKRKALAERFFRGVYGGDPSVVGELAGDEVVSTYPVFEKLFNTTAIRGREALEEFATGFGKRWTGAQITIHEAVAEGNSVVLMWSFRARWSGSSPQDEARANQERSWGGITLFRFDSSGRIVAEIGEESAPGPAERVATGGG